MKTIKFTEEQITVLQSVIQSELEYLVEANKDGCECEDQIKSVEELQVHVEAELTNQQN